MSEATKKNYIKVGKGVEKFDGGLIEISVCLSDIPQEHRFQYEGKWYTKLKVNRNRDGVDDYGKSHYVTINEWKPEAQEQKPAPPVAKKEEKVTPDLPF
jgi:hypothetical protein